MSLPTTLTEILRTDLPVRIGTMRLNQLYGLVLCEPDGSLKQPPLRQSCVRFFSYAHVATLTGPNLVYEHENLLPIIAGEPVVVATIGADQLGWTDPYMYAASDFGLVDVHPISTRQHRRIMYICVEPHRLDEVYSL